MARMSLAEYQRRAALLPRSVRDAMSSRSRPCDQPNSTGNPCRATVAVLRGLPDVYAEACPYHLGDYDGFIEQARSIQAAYDAVMHDPAEDEPACWSWPLPPHPEAAAGSTDDRTAWNVFVDWHDDRCAIHGGRLRNRFVIDHDYDTSLIRGLLCQSCNIREGNGEGLVFDNYRARPASAVIGFVQVYKTPFAVKVTR